MGGRPDGAEEGGVEWPPEEGGAEEREGGVEEEWALGSAVRLLGEPPSPDDLPPEEQPETPPPESEHERPPGKKRLSSPSRPPSTQPPHKKFQGSVAMAVGKNRRSARQAGQSRPRLSGGNASPLGEGPSALPPRRSGAPQDLAIGAKPRGGPSRPGGSSGSGRGRSALQQLLQSEHVADAADPWLAAANAPAGLGPQQPSGPPPGTGPQQPSGPPPGALKIATAAASAHRGVARVEPAAWIRPPVVAGTPSPEGQPFAPRRLLMVPPRCASPAGPALGAFQGKPEGVAAVLPPGKKHSAAGVAAVLPPDPKMLALGMRSSAQTMGMPSGTLPGRPDAVAGGAQRALGAGSVAQAKSHALRHEQAMSVDEYHGSQLLQEYGFAGPSEPTGRSAEPLVRPRMKAGPAKATTTKAGGRPPMESSSARPPSTPPPCGSVISHLLKPHGPPSQRSGHLHGLVTPPAAAASGTSTGTRLSGTTITGMWRNAVSATSAFTEPISDVGGGPAPPPGPPPKAFEPAGRRRK